MKKEIIIKIDEQYYDAIDKIAKNGDMSIEEACVKMLETAGIILTDYFKDDTLH